MSGFLRGSQRISGLLVPSRRAIRRAESNHDDSENDTEPHRSCIRKCIFECVTKPCISCGLCVISSLGLRDEGVENDPNEEFVKILMKDEISTNKEGDFTFPSKSVPIPVDVQGRGNFSVGRLKVELAAKILTTKKPSSFHVFETVGKYKTYKELTDEDFLPVEGDIYLSVDITIKVKLIQAFHHPLSEKSVKQRTVPRRINLTGDDTVQVGPNATIREIRQAVATVRDTQPQYISMFWKGNWLSQDGLGLKTFSIRDGCTILVRESPWLIQIQTLSREVVFVCTYPSDPAQHLRQALAPCINPNIPLEDYEFVAADGLTVFEDQLSSDEEQPTLEFLGVQNGGVLYMVPKTDNTPEGCTIPKAEHRGINLVQLRQIAAIILQKCVPEGWRSTNPEHGNKLLKPEEVTLYDFMNHYIKKITSTRKCSYVELVSKSPRQQIPSYFCSHWWGEYVLDFVACLEQHAKDRGIPDTTPYWVCAYALNQHDVAGELSGGKPKESPFFRAMSLTKGTVSVLDGNAICYNRIWCAYEIALVMHELKKGGSTGTADQEEYLYDVYTTVNTQRAQAVPVGLLDRVTAGHSKQLQTKDVAFPLDTLHKALTMQLERANASMSQDKMMILNSIIGRQDLTCLPPQYHSSYDNLNASLRARLAESTYPIALEKGHTKIADFRLALANAPYDELSVSFSGCKEFLPEARLFWRRSLPNGLSGLDLDVGNLPLKSSDEFVIGLGRMTKLKKLKLTAKDCRQLKDAEHVWKEIGNLIHLEELDVDFSGCSVVGMDGPWDRPLHNLPDLVRLRFNFAGSANSSLNISGFKRLSKVSELSVNVSENALASIEGTEEALASYRDLKHLELRCKGLLKVQTMRQLTDSMVTRKLESLSLDFNGCSGLQNVDGLGSVIQLSPELREVALDFQYCRQLVTIDELMKGFSRSKFPKLVKLSLEFGYCVNLKLRDLVLVSENNMPNLRSLKISFAGCRNVLTGVGLLKGFSSFQGRKFDCIDINLTGTNISPDSARKLSSALSIDHVRADSFQFLVPNGAGFMD